MSASINQLLCHIDDITKLKWLPIKEQLQWLLLKAVNKAICHVCSPTWPSYLNVDIVNHTRTLRSNSGISLAIPMESGTFQDEAAKLLNELPWSVRNCSDFSIFSKSTFNYLMERIKKT